MRVPNSAIFGGEGRGLGVVQHFFNENRIRQAASSLGAAQFCIDESVAYAKERKPFGKPLATNQAIQFPLVELQTQCEMLRALIHKTAWLMDTEGAFSQSDKVSMCNYWANRLCCEAADRAMQVHGGLGYSRHKPFEHIYRHHRRYRITEGAEEIQMRRVAGYMFGFMNQQAPKGVDSVHGPGRRRRLAFRPCSSPRRRGPPRGHRTSARRQGARRRPADLQHQVRVAGHLAHLVEREVRLGPDNAGPRAPAARRSARRGRSTDPQAALAERLRAGDDDELRGRAWTALVEITRAGPGRRQAGPRRVGGGVTLDLAEGLADLPRRGVAEDVAVGNLSTTTAGARRHNVLFEAEAGGTVHHLVATIVPFGETIINPIDAEAGVRALAEKAGVAVPHVHLAREDGELVGGPFMISEFVPGETVPRRVLRLVAEHGIGELVATQLGESLARLHAIDPAPSRCRCATLEVAADEPDRRRPARRCVRRSTSCRSAGRRSSSGCAGSSATARRRRCAGRSSTPTSATATSSSARTACAPCSTGRARWRRATRCRTWPGRRCGCGASATRPPRSAGSPAGRRTSPATRRPAARSTSTASSGGRSRARCAGRVGLAGQTMAFLDGRVPSIVMAASGRRVSELEWDLLMLIRPR